MELAQFWAVFGAVVMVGVGGFYGYGRLTERVEGINKRLDTQNGAVNDLRRDVADHGERIARVEGSHERGPSLG